jgi:glutathione S-transferase
MLHLAQLPALAVRRAREGRAEIDAWTGIDNVPAVMHDSEPVRSNWAAIVGLLDRLATPGRILPTAIAARAATIGTLEVIAGEGGIGWNARLAMVDAGLTTNGAAGFPPTVAATLGKRYGYGAGVVDVARRQMGEQLAYVAAQLAGDYFGGEQPNALDVYCATFMTPVAAPISESECPDLHPALRTAFASAYVAFGALVPESLRAHRERMFERHLPRPIRL